MNNITGYSIFVKSSAQKSLNKLPIKIAEQIIIKIQELKLDACPSYAKKLQGVENTYRIRIGSYRIIYQVINKELVILVLRISHRKKAYK